MAEVSDTSNGARARTETRRITTMWSMFGLFTRLTRNTVRTRTAFREVSIILNSLRAPLVVSIIAVIVFGFPGQIQEIYRLMAEAFDWRNEFNQANLRFIVFFVLLYLLGYALWYIGRVLTLVNKECLDVLTDPDVDGAVARWAPRMLGAAPSFAAAYGMTRAEQLRPVAEFSTPGLYGAAAIALLIGLHRLWSSWRRTRHNRQLYEDLSRSWLRVDIRLALSLLLLGGVAFLMTQPVTFAQWVGALSIICFFLIALVYGWAHLTFLYDEYAIPALTILIGAALVWSLFDLNDNHFVRTLTYTTTARMSDAAFDAPEPRSGGLGRAALELDALDPDEEAVDEKPSAASRAVDLSVEDGAAPTPDLRVQRNDSANAKLRDLETPSPRAAEIEDEESFAAETAVDAPLTLPQAFRAWYNSRADREAFEQAGKNYPVYIVAAQGGGMYAAYQAATFLAQIQDGCPNFAQHVFAISGVSGGAVGASVFTGLAMENAQNVPINDVSPCGAAPAGRPTELANQVDTILSQDFLSPLISGALFGDFTARFSPTPIGRFDRARALERAFEGAWVRAERRVSRALSLEANEKGGAAEDYRQVFDGDEETNPLARGLLSYWRPDGAPPALFYNTTQVENGERMVFSPIPDLGELLDSYALKVETNAAGETPDIRLSTAMVLSSRFPYITPAASMAIQPTNDPDRPTLPKVRLVDGGYFENSGIETAFDIMQQLGNRLRNRQQRERRRAAEELDPKAQARARARRVLRRLPIDFRLIILDLTDDRFRPAKYSLGETLSPVKAILNSRVSRAQLAEARAREQLDSPCRYLLVGGVRAIGRGGGAVAEHSCPYSEMRESQVWSVSLNDYDYDFQLGWLLSRSALNLIRQQLGRPENCTVSAEADPDLAGLAAYPTKLQREEDDQVARHNSCIAKFIIEQLRRDG